MTATKDGSTQYLAATLAPWINDTYTYYAYKQEQFATYCCASASPFEVCPETATHNRTTVVVAHIPDSQRISLMVGKVGLLLWFRSISFEALCREYSRHS